MKRNQNQPDLIIPGSQKGLSTIIEFKKNFSKVDLNRMTNVQREFWNKMQEILVKHKDAIDEISEAILEYERNTILENPVIYVARTKDIKTEKEYFTAKTTWPMKDGKKKEIKIYLGRAGNFNGDTLSPKAKELALVKMRQTLARRIRSGEI
jgi:acyl-ACP thioesterase